MIIPRLISSVALFAVFMFGSSMQAVDAGSAQQTQRGAPHSVGYFAPLIGKGISQQIDEAMGRPTGQSIKAPSYRRKEPKYPRDSKDKRREIFIVDDPWWRRDFDRFRDGNFVQFVVNRTVANQGFDLSRTFGVGGRGGQLDTIVIDARPRRGYAYVHILVDGRPFSSERIGQRRRLVYDLHGTSTRSHGQPTIGVVFAGGADLYTIGARIGRP